MRLSLCLREEHKLQRLENRLFRKAFGARKKKVNNEGYFVTSEFIQNSSIIRIVKSRMRNEEDMQNCVWETSRERCYLDCCGYILVI
jgi:hypothetical protein